MFDKNLRLPEIPDDVRERIESMLEALSTPPKLSEDRLSEMHQTLQDEAFRRDEELTRMFTKKR